MERTCSAFSSRRIRPKGKVEAVSRTQIATYAAIILDRWEKLPSGGNEFLDILYYNANAIADSGMTEQIGAAFFPLFGFVNHRCVPNVRYATARKAGKLFGQLIAVTDIAQGEEVVTDVVNNNHGVERIFDSKADKVRTLPMDIRYEMVLRLAEQHSFRCACDDCMKCVRCSRFADTHCFKCGFAWCSTACRVRDEFHADACPLMINYRRNFRRIQNGMNA